MSIKEKFEDLKLPEFVINEVINDSKIEQVIEEFVSDFIEYSHNLPDQRVVNEVDQERFDLIKNTNIPKKGRLVKDVVDEMINDVYYYGHNPSHPRYFGFVPSNVSLLSWLGDILTAAFNRHAGSLANFPVGCNVENQVIEWLCQQAGYDKKAGGLFVSGGSMANMSALTIARDKILDEDSWHLGVAYVSGQTHSSVAKGLRIIGISNQRIRKVPVNKDYQMDVVALKEMIEADKQKGLLPFVVVASAGTTNTGSIDPFKEIAKICQEYQIWMHVDGAFGASVLLSNTYRHLLSGIELADSISWDGHKWLFQTYGCGMVLVKEKRDMANAFHVHPEYLKDLETGDEDALNPWDLGIELTRPARGLKLWVTLQTFGSDAISDAIDHGIHLARLAQRELEKISDVEIVSPAQLAMINFRFNPNDYNEKQKDDLNQLISKKIIDSGYAGVFTTELNGKKVLRICCINPKTSYEDMCNTVKLLNQFYHECTGN